MKPNLIKWGCLLLMCIVSFTVKAEKFTVSLNSKALEFSSTYETASIDEISGKIAADVRFKEIIDLDIAVGKKVRSLSSSDKKLFRTALNEQNASELLKLFSKAGVDFKDYSSKKHALVSAVFKEYELAKISDKAKVLKSAALKLNLTDFADCIDLWSTGFAGCALWPEEYRLDCFSLVTAIFGACIASLP
jgi:hypothetical protein